MSETNINLHSGRDFVSGHTVGNAQVRFELARKEGMGRQGF